MASTVSAAVIVASPVMGQIRGLLRDTFPTQFTVMVGGSMAGAAVAAIVIAIARIRTNRQRRYGLVVAAFGVAVIYSVIMRSGIADVDAVERVHFLEYGLITWLFYRAWLSNGDASALSLPVLAALLVGTLDEFVQWFVPVRVGEMRDVLLNLVAIGCGLTFGAGIEPPSMTSARLNPASARILAGVLTVTVLALAGFISSVHIGHIVSLSERIRFKSHYTRGELTTLAGDRAVRWRTAPPVELRRYSREDQYMDEGLWHIRRRNEDWTEENYGAAWNENLILETFFTPVLDTSSYALPAGARWPPAQRAGAAARAPAPGAPLPYESGAEPYPILLWPKPVFWLTVTLLLALAVAVLMRTAGA